ncbi:MAG: hypothetical protein K5877_11275 [Lachnospiraceae bacterium]|nr:hypothetical protein [Lachnospiraceae bacterium]
MGSKVVLKILSILTRILLILVIVAGSIIVGRKSYEFGYRVFAEQPMAPDAEHARKINVQITEKMSNRDIAALMVKKGLARNEVLFYAQIISSDYKNSIQPGLYVLSTDMTAGEILEIIGQKRESDENSNNSGAADSEKKDEDNSGK